MEPNNLTRRELATILEVTPLMLSRILICVLIVLLQK